MDEIKVEVKNHFHNCFLESEECRPVLDGIHFSQISDLDNAESIAPCSLEEIKEVVWRGTKVRNQTDSILTSTNSFGNLSNMRYVTLLRNFIIMPGFLRL